VRVVPDVPAIQRRFDYTVPAALEGEIRLGSRVRIDLHGRRVGGWVVEDRVEAVPGVALKPLAGSSGEGPPPSVVAVAEWAAWRWSGPLSSMLGSASPPRVVRLSAESRSNRSRPAMPSSSPMGSPPSPGGGSVSIVTDALTGPGSPSVVRLAPALDAALLVSEVVHRLGGHSVLILAPSRARAAQVADRLARSGVETALLPDQWEQAASGRAAVVGARAAAWAPIERLRGAVVLDAHDEAYREERAPNWSAVDVVIERARRHGAPVILVSACPPVTQTEGVRVVHTERPLERRGWPILETVDRTADDPRTGLVSERLARLLHTVLEGPAGRAVCILNRTGRISLLACVHCGSVVRCTRCGGAMAQPAAGGALKCRRCQENRPPVCAECDSSRLRSIRIGVTRATEELSALTGVEAVEVTGSSAPEVPGTARLVVGTEAALHRVGRADAVAFLEFDQHLLAPRFLAAEQSLALLARASRLVGTRDRGGRVLVQTRIPEHEVLRAAERADPGLLTAAERPLRRSLELPPFGALSALRGPGGAGLAAGLALRPTLTTSSLGPDRWLVHAPDHQTLCDALATVERPAERVRVEVDPIDV
jgi:primosomal protein N' (replication factor Y)